MKISITLNAAETVMLQEMLQHQLSELRMEISHTDRMDYREKLKERKRVLRKILDALHTEPVAQ